MKKLLIAGLATSLVLTACGGAQQQTKNKTLKVYAFKNPYGGENGEAWKAVGDAFEKLNPGVKVEITYASNINETLKTQINAGENPDVVYFNQGQPSKFTEGLIGEKKLEDISDLMNMKIPGEETTVGNKLAPGVSTLRALQPYGDGKTYIAPLFASGPGIAYNSNLVGEGKKYAYPKTWDEFFTVAEKAKQDGVAAFTYPTSGYLDSLIPVMVANIGGEELLTKFLNYETDIYKDPRIVKVFETIGKLKDYTKEDTVANASRDKGFLDNQHAIMQNKALFMPNGDWVVGEMKDYKAADGFKWALGTVPTFEANGKHHVLNWVENVYTLKDSPNKDLAKQFMAFLYSDTAVKTFAANGGYQPIKDIEKFMSAESLELVKALKTNTTAISGNTFAATESIPGVKWSDVLYGNVDNVLSGKLSVSDWLNELNNANNQLHAKIIK